MRNDNASLETVKFIVVDFLVRVSLQWALISSWRVLLLGEDRLSDEYYVSPVW